MSTLFDVFSTVFERHAERPAVVEGDTVTTYADLEMRVAACALALHESGIHSGDRVAVMISNGLDYVVSYFAAVSLGAIVVPMNDHYQQNELLYFLNECDVSLLVTSHQFEPLCRQVLVQYARPCKLILAGEIPECDATLATLRALALDIDPDAPVMYQYSSGTTGRPKRIARTHRNLVFELDSLIETLGLTHADRFMGAAPFSHVNGLMRSMMASLRAGAALYPHAKFERQAIAASVEKNRITVFIAVPFMFTTLAQSNFRPRPDFSSLRLCVSASAPMPEKLNRQFQEQFGRYVRQLYGSSETGTISVNLGADIERTLTSVGTPLSGVRVEVFRDDGQIAASGEMGEFAVASPGAITAYPGLPDVNRQVFHDGFFFTGDVGHKDENGFLYLTGRKKFFINKGGFKIDPREVEELIESHPRVHEVVVLGVPSAFGDEKVKAVIVASEPCTEEEIVQYCRGKIADFKVPSVIEFRDSLPKSPTGKIRREMLQ